MCSNSLPFSKVSAKNIYICGQKLGKNDMAYMVSNEESHTLDFQQFQIDKFFLVDIFKFISILI